MSNENDRNNITDEKRRAIAAKCRELGLKRKRDLTLAKEREAAEEIAKEKADAEAKEMKARAIPRAADLSFSSVKRSAIIASPEVSANADPKPCKKRSMGRSPPNRRPPSNEFMKVDCIYSP